MRKGAWGGAEMGPGLGRKLPPGLLASPFLPSLGPPILGRLHLSCLLPILPSTWTGHTSRQHEGIMVLKEY